MAKFTVFLMIAAACFSSCVALKCYSGNYASANGTYVRRNIAKVDCGKLSQNDTEYQRTHVCMTYISDLNGTKQVNHSCSKTGENFIACKAYEGFAEHCSICDTHLCNGSSLVGFNNIWVTFIPVIITVAQFLF